MGLAVNAGLSISNEERRNISHSRYMLIPPLTASPIKDDQDLQ